MAVPTLLTWEGMLRYRHGETATKGTKLVGLIFLQIWPLKMKLNQSFLDIERRNFEKNCWVLRIVS